MRGIIRGIVIFIDHILSSCYSTMSIDCSQISLENSNTTDALVKENSFTSLILSEISCLHKFISSMSLESQNMQNEYEAMKGKVGLFLDEERQKVMKENEALLRLKDEEIQRLLKENQAKDLQLRRLLQWKSDHTFKFNNQSLRIAVDLWFSNRAECEGKYGIIGEWDTSEVTDMQELFYKRTEFNENISKWNVSKVTNMSRMFRGASSFNQPLGAWNVSMVSIMAGMFNGASSFNQSLSSWNVSKVTNFGWMFSDASSFNVAVNAPWYGDQE